MTDAPRDRQPPTLPATARWQGLVERALAEDLGSGDVTSEIVFAADAKGRARIEAREPLVVCGLPIATEVFRQVDPSLRFEGEAAEGTSVGPGTRLATIEGAMRGILAGERTALNFLGRLCGIATLSARFVEETRGTAAVVTDTRKTLPGWRELDKYAVVCGGAHNHRVGLFDGILLKDNHIAAGGGVASAVSRALERAPAHLRVQVEVQSEDEAEAAIGAGADFLLIDNQSPDQIRRFVQRFGERATLEASGGIHLANLRAYAETGVHRISVGALTHSAPGSDVALEIDLGGVSE